MKETIRLWHNVFGPAGSEYAKWVRRHSICPLIGNILGHIVGFALGMWILLSLVGCGAVTDEPVSTVPETTTQVTVTEAPVLESREPLASKPVQAENQDGRTTLDDGTVIVIPQATEKPAETADKPAATSRPAAKAAYTETEIDTEYGRLIKAGDWYLFDFGTEGAAGFGMDGLLIHHEAYYGVKASTDGTVVSYELYNHTEDKHPVKAIVVKRIETDKNARLDIPAESETAGFDLAKEPDGMYVLIVKYEGGEYCWTALYKEDGAIHAVQAWKPSYSNAENRAIEMAERAERTRLLVEGYGFTPEGILDGEAFVFPRPSLDESDKWRELAHEIVPDGTLPGSVKALMVYDWMSENMKYDYYLRDVIHEDVPGEARDCYYGDFSGTWSIYNTHTGVCRDFAGIANVMLRELGIPSVYVSTGGHVYNLVWIDGQWHAFDITDNSTSHAVWGEDTDDTREHSLGPDRYDSFLPFRDTYLDRIIDMGVFTRTSPYCC